MQTPAPFDYERATSVEGAIASLARARGDARIIAGGHSLLPMMKLRLADARAPDRHQRSARARVHPRGGRRDRDRRADAPRRPARVRAAGPALPGVPRRRGGDRRPGRPQPRHDRRLAVPGRRGRGPLSAVCAALKASVVIRGAERRARRRAWTSSTSARGRPRSARTRCSPRSGSARRRSGGSAHEKVERRAGDWAIAAVVGGGLARRRDDRRRRASRSARSARPRSTLTRAEELLRGQAAVGGAVRAGGRDRVRGLQRRSPTAAAPADYKRHLAGVLTQARAAPRHRASPAQEV